MAEVAGVPPKEATRSGMGMKPVLAIVVALIAFLAGLGAGYYAFSPPQKLRLVVALNAPYAPFESYNDTKATFEGLDVDIAQLIATDLGRELVLRNFVDFGILLATVGQGGVDVAVAAITMSGPDGAKRNATMDFSNPYFSTDQAVVIRTNYAFSCANNVCTAADVLNHKIGVQSSTTSESWVDQYITPNQTNPDTTIHRYPNVATEFDGLQTSVYDLMIIDAATAKASTANSGGVLKVAGIIPTGELYGIAVPNNDPKGFLPSINALLARIKADGRYDALIIKWFG